MLELLVNEDKDAAEKLFHDIVVEKSRDIYEGLLEDDKDVDETTDEEVDEASDEEVDESDEDLDEASDEEVDEASDDEEVDESFNLDEFEVEADPMGGDKTDDMLGDLGMDEPEGDEADMGDMGDAEDDADVEDRVEDLEDALDDLKAEFERMMAGDEADMDDGEEADMDADDGEEEPEEGYAFEASDEEVDEASDEEVEEASDEEVEESKTNKTAGEEMREYVEKVSATMGDNGANTKSSVANPNNMGGTASNLNQGSEEKGGDHTGLGDASPKDQDGGNVNVPGGKASKSLKAAPGHGAEKKGKPEAAADKKSLIGSK
jgi:hypothetical protein